MKLFKPKGKGFFNEDSLAIVDIKNIDGTDGLLVTYKDGNQVVYENYDKIIDRKGTLKEEFSSAISSFNKLNNLNNEVIDNIQIGDIIYYNNEFMIVDNNLLNTLLSQDTTYKLDIFGDESCIACYPLDGNANDLSGNYNMEVIGGNFVDAKFNQGYEVGQEANNTNYLKLSNSNLLLNKEQLTISLWIYKYKNNDYNVFFSYADSNKDNITILYENNDKLNLQIYNNYYELLSDYISATQQWNHIVLVQNNDNTRIFVNNEMIVDKTTETTNFTNTTNCLIFGQEQDSLCGNFDINQSIIGIYDQIRIFNRALTPEEIQILYNEQTPLIKKLSF